MYNICLAGKPPKLASFQLRTWSLLKEEASSRAWGGTSFLQCRCCFKDLYRTWSRENSLQTSQNINLPTIVPKTKTNPKIHDTGRYFKKPPYHSIQQDIKLKHHQLPNKKTPQESPQNMNLSIKHPTKPIANNPSTSTIHHFPPRP